jgi:hypothetical protein
VRLRGRISQYAAYATLACFFAADVWWRAAGEPFRGGVLIVGAALVVIVAAAAAVVAARLRHRRR